MGGGEENGGREKIEEEGIKVRRWEEREEWGVGGAEDAKRVVQQRYPEEVDTCGGCCVRRQSSGEDEETEEQ
jgi:hypothetical protein